MDGTKGHYLGTTSFIFLHEEVDIFKWVDSLIKLHKDKGKP